MGRSSSSRWKPWHRNARRASSYEMRSCDGGGRSVVGCDGTCPAVAGPAAEVSVAPLAAAAPSARNLRRSNQDLAAPLTASEESPCASVAGPLPPSAPAMPCTSTRRRARGTAAGRGKGCQP